MAVLARLISQVFPAEDENANEALPVLMFTIIGLLLLISFTVAFGLPSPIDFETF
jgi:hypothetical protein